MTVPDSISLYDAGDMFRAVATFVSTDGLTTADPSVIDLIVKNPLGSVSTYRYGGAGASVVRVATGVYARDVAIPFSADSFGSWQYAYVGTGGVNAAETWQIVVERNFIL